MKKEYFKPETEILMMSPVSMLAISGPGFDHEEGDGSDLTRKSRGEWGNVWK